jgi:polyisoprenoid-binding protein YceI
MKGLINPDENTFAFTVDIRSFEGFNSDLQRTHFNENYMESQKFPRASFSGKIIEKIDWEGSGTHQLRAKGILDIHGVKQERILPGTVELFADRVFIHTEFSVPLEDHDIDIPKIVAQKISEEIKVFIEITLDKQPSN